MTEKPKVGDVIVLAEGLEGVVVKVIPSTGGMTGGGRFAYGGGGDSWASCTEFWTSPLRNSKYDPNSTLIRQVIGNPNERTDAVRSVTVIRTMQQKFE